MKFKFPIKTKITINLLASYHQDNFKQISNSDSLDKGSEQIFLINQTFFQTNQILKMKINLLLTDFSLQDCSRSVVAIKTSKIPKLLWMAQSQYTHLDV